MGNSDQRITPRVCPHLGLHDDQRTSLAYPSEWNYCFRAHPPSPVRISHQIAACLSPEYAACPVYKAKQTAALPVQLRGRSNAPSWRRKLAPKKTGRLIWLALAVLFLITSFIAVREFSPGYLSNPFLPILNAYTSFKATAELNRVPTESPVPATPTQSSSTRIVQTQQVPQSTPVIPTAMATRTPIPKRCGYTLDTLFGAEPKFTLHQIAIGENLDKLAEINQTTTDAIRSVNFSMPVPIWENWIVIIPVDVLDVSGLPAFEPYQADGTIFSLVDLALALGTDVQSLSKYNAFTEACTVFRGWLIVPRASETTSE